ncbi:MAG TPA: hypothetical protein PK453_18210 [Leptospiraceae bacterium]|nr:hypothetical protein [Leptospiraceae bacterium]HNF15605.1 hypothetical protein [Leptospiraceae bacterium]HNI95381.1 hypothetical protein [Leptospiraceae bacterium]HNM03446.1 hypothetical protein [Leptospiraceae bacterium]HNN05616.1 hypothetical protein [Leptospiraceae bacterium]
MIKNTIFILSIIGAVLNTSACKEEKTTKPVQIQTPEEIRNFIKDSEWTSIAVELRPQEDRTGSGKIQPFYVSRTFKFTDKDKFTGTIRSFGDPYGKLPLVQFEFKGRVEWQGEHPVAKGAQKIDYVLDEGFIVTPLHQNFADALNSVPAKGLKKFELNVPQDILKKEFPLFSIKEGQIVKDYDLIYIYEGMLFMGAKHVDGTPFDKPENRPHLLQIPLVRKK